MFYSQKDPVKQYASSSLQNGQLLLSYFCERPCYNAFSFAFRLVQYFFISAVRSLGRVVHCTNWLGCQTQKLAQSKTQMVTVCLPGVGFTRNVSRLKHL